MSSFAGLENARAGACRGKGAAFGLENPQGWGAVFGEGQGLRARARAALSWFCTKISALPPVLSKILSHRPQKPLTERLPFGIIYMIPYYRNVSPGRYDQMTIHGGFL